MMKLKVTLASALAVFCLLVSLPLLADESEQEEKAQQTQAEEQEKPAFVPYEEPDLDLGLCDS